MVFEARGSVTVSSPITRLGKHAWGSGFGKKRTELIKIEMEDYLYDLVSVEFCLQILPKGS